MSLTEKTCWEPVLAPGVPAGTSIRWHLKEKLRLESVVLVKSLTIAASHPRIYCQLYDLIDNSLNGNSTFDTADRKALASWETSNRPCLPFQR